MTSPDAWRAPPPLTKSPSSLSAASTASAWGGGGAGAPSRGASPDWTAPGGASPPPHPALDATDALSARRALALGANVASATGPGEPPLALVAASGTWATDAAGKRYLDCQNNVAAVGHAHPAVCAAVAGAWTALNTNVRYAHAAPVAHAEAIRALLPASMDAVVYHTASGSEANDLALRVAAAAADERRGAGGASHADVWRRNHVAVLAGAYHGHAGAAGDVSPYYQHGGPPGTAAPPWVHVVPTPDALRGVTVDPAAAAAAVLDRAAAAGACVCAFMFEAVPSCAGQIMLPPGWLATLATAFRAAGAALIADEVQTGVGRTGHPFAWQAHLASPPDAVTMGKGIANGYPIGLLAVNRALAAPFASRGRYFSTFGGSTAACAASLATLNVIARGRLQEAAARVGAYALARLRAAVGSHPAVGEVRGVGLMIGVEFVVRAPSLPPNAAAAAWVTAAARGRGLLLSADGVAKNVAKIKPPLVFTERDADALVSTLGAVMGELPVELYGSVDV